MTAARPCPGDLLAGLVDGQLDHQARERVQRHLVNCTDCRARRAAQADLKLLVRQAPVPPMSGDLTARLLGLAASAAGAAGAGDAEGASPTGIAGPRRLTGRQRLSLSGCLAVLSLSAAFALGAPHGEPPVVRLDPGTDVFVADYAGVTADLPVIAGVTSVGPPRR